MAMSKADSRRMYSWWWNSHISPKNSKWLQENLTDMDISVKSMIKLIEEDADSFARRAEMYYKKRPELMKLVEEFYRAYRALAERYDHATGALRQAHKTMTEAFPNQVPLLPDDSPANSASDGDPQTPEKRTPARAMFDLDDFPDEDSDAGQKGLKQLNDLVSSKGTVRKGLKFEHVGVTEEEILLLKEAIAKLEKEKEAGLKQYQESMERLTKLESEISHAQADSKKLTDQASKAEAEVQTLKNTLHGLEAEKEEVLKLYHQCLDKITNLEIALSQAQEHIEELNEQAKNGENVVQILKQDITRLEDEKNAAHDQYKQSLEIKSDLEKKLMEAEEEAKKFTERAQNAESEVETLKQAITKLTEEKEAQAFLYQQCMEIISSLELRLSCAQEENKRLNGEIDNGASMLKGVEDQRLTLEKSNQALHSELESMVLTIENQTQELTEKEKELGKLWTCIQEERLRFVEAETAFQTLQHLHSQAQDELRSLALELQNRGQILRDMETRNHGLQGEIQKHIEENKNLNELNLSSAISLKDMQSEISSLMESKGKLEEEVVLRVDQRNALQQEIYCLKEELNELNKDHKAILEQVSCVGLKPESLGSSVKELQDENCSLKEECQTEKSAKVALLEKLEIMGQLLEKNAVLENSLSDLGVELEGAREKIKALEESYQSLLEEKSSLSVEKANLLGQLQVTTENLSLVSEKNSVLESSLLEAHVELELLKQKSKSFEDSCHSLANEKSALISEKGALVSEKEIIEKLLKDLELRYKDLEEKYSAMEKERESTLQKVEELHASLTVQNQEHISYAQTNMKQLDRVKSQIQILQEEKQIRSKEFDQELDKAMGSEIEIFILLRCVQEIEEANVSLFNDCQKLLEASKLSERLIHELKQEKYENQVKITSLADQNNRLRIGLHQLLKVSGIALNPGCEFDQDQTCFDSIRSKVEGTNHALVETENKNHELIVETSILVTLLRQLHTELANLEAEKYSIRQESSVRAEKILELQNEAEKLSKANEELRLKVGEGDHNEKVLRTQLENLHGELSIVQGAYNSLQTTNSVVLEEKSALAKNNFDMEERMRHLEDENSVIFDEAFCRSNLSLVLEKYLDEKYAEINGISQDLQNLHHVNKTLVEKVSTVEKKLEEVQMENLHLKETLQKSTHELKTVISTHDQLNTELLNTNNLLHLKEREHMEAAQKFTILENEKANLTSLLAGLQKEYDEVKMTSDEQGKHILKLSEDNDHLSKERMCLDETIKLLELKVHQLCEEQERSKHREENLCSEMQKEKNEAQSLETHASEVYGDLQTSTFHQVLLEEKVRELTEVCMSLQDESTSKDVDIGLLNERTSVLECENGDLKARLAAYGSALISLKDCILSLENHTSVQKFENDEAKDDEQVDQKTVSVSPDALVNVQDLQRKVKAIETAVMEIEKLKTQEKLDADAKLEAAMKNIEELRNQNRRSKSKSTSEISKDIMLDEASEYSSCGISKRELVEGEIWEITDQNGSIDMNIDNSKSVKVKVKNFEKEVSVSEKLAVSRRFDEGNKRKVLERLNSDVQKLTNLQITVEDLKRKLEITETSRRGKTMVECETLKGQLGEAELSIQKLYEVNGKLVKHIDTEKSTTESEESQSMRRKKISEQARKVSEKIGRLQLEVQRIQFVLLKLDDEREVKVKGKSRFLDANRRVLLKDYLYGGERTKATISSIKGKKRHFCACVAPPTKGD